MPTNRLGHARVYALIAALLAACDGGGGTGADRQAPTITLVSPAPLADDLTGTLALSATASDNVRVASVEYQIDGRPVASSSSGPSYAASVALAQHVAGQHVVRARALDAAGNASAWSSATVRFGGSTTIASGFAKDESWVGPLNAATAFAQAPDGRLFVAEQGGAVRIVKNGVLLPTPFLQLVVDSAGERGLIGIALHPDFANNGYVYLHYTSAVGGTHNRISRVRAIPASADVASLGSEEFLVELPLLSAATNHNGGAIHFGTDGKLYAAVGDNGNGANSQNVNSPLGKLLRFNDDSTIPNDNPFFATSSGLGRAVWAYGLRNPFTFAVQPGTGRIHINDVGDTGPSWEEINVSAAGANFGWPNTQGPTTTPGVTAPLFAYPRNPSVPPGSGPGGFFTGASIAGGAFYPPGGAFPAELHGNYFFADFIARFVARLDPANGNAVYAFASLAGSPVDMLVGVDGALLVLTRNGITRITAN